ncbi:MAG: hypothetical protein ACYC6T_08285 [Thermoleophilia bacterium]
MASPHSLPPDVLEKLQEAARRIMVPNVSSDILRDFASLQQTHAQQQMATFISQITLGPIQQAVELIQTALGPSFGLVSTQLAAAFQNSSFITATVRDMNLRLVQLGEGLDEYQIPVPSELTSAVMAGTVVTEELTETEFQAVRMEAWAIRERLVSLIMLLAVMAAVVGTAAGSAPVAAIGTLVWSANQIWSWIEKLVGTEGGDASGEDT